MIKANFVVAKGKAGLNYEDKELVYGDVVLLIYEMERLKKELLEKEFDITEIREANND